MKLLSTHIYKFRLPLKEPLNIGNTVLKNREGAIIQINSDSNTIGFGEASPLPGLHKENLKDTINQLEIIQTQLNGISVESAFDIINQKQESHWYPSVQFAVDSALYNLVDGVNSPGMIKVLPISARDKICINSLVTGSLEFLEQKVADSLDKNYRAIKLKIGRWPLNEEINLIRAIQHKIGNSSILRLDANRNWTFAQAVKFVKSIEISAIDYLEEPLKNPEELHKLFQETDISLALDESLVEMSPSNLKSLDWIKAIILKPSIIGSMDKSLEYISIAEKLGIKTVISDTFHSGIGLSFLVRLASIMDGSIPMGFDTYNWLDDDILVDRFQVEDGCFDVKTVMEYGKNIDYSKLEKVV
jgi:o-succinylbenzoate synthase